MKKPQTFLLMLLLIGFPLRHIAQQIKSKDREAILEIMEAQEQAWNRGDPVAFMEGYWESDSLIFIGSGGLTLGWQQSLDNYRASYPNEAAMGTLTFTILKIFGEGKRSAFVIGRWHLDREAGNLEGHFSLLWRKMNGLWRIVADHSS